MLGYANKNIPHPFLIEPNSLHAACVQQLGLCPNNSGIIFNVLVDLRHD